MTVFDKFHELKDALQGDSGPSGDQKDEQKEGWSDKIREALDGGEAKKKLEEEENRLRIEKEREEARAKVEAERSLAGKIHDRLDGGKHRQELEEAEFEKLEAQAQLEKKKDSPLGGVLGHVSEFKDKVDSLTREPREQADKKEEVEQEHLHDKVKELWTKAPKDEKVAQEEHHHAWKQTKEEEKTSGGWRDQLRALTGQGQKEEKKKVERGWLKEKFNEMAGGGQTSEADEDKLDKTVDFIQEHILHQGDQSDESALEQMKDEQISDAIRRAYKAVTGNEVPVKDK